MSGQKGPEGLISSKDRANNELKEAFGILNDLSSEELLCILSGIEKVKKYLWSVGDKEKAIIKKIIETPRHAEVLEALCTAKTKLEGADEDGALRFIVSISPMDLENFKDLTKK